MAIISVRPKYTATNQPSKGGPSKKQDTFAFIPHIDHKCKKLMKIACCLLWWMSCLNRY